jgi:hypothetical protein
MMMMIIVIIIIIIIIIMYCNSNVSGNYWAIVSSKLSKPPGDPDYRESTIYIYIYFILCAYAQMTVTEVFYLTTLSTAKIIRRWR